jgi:hypothetical protein
MPLKQYKFVHNNVVILTHDACLKVSSMQIHFKVITTLKRIPIVFETMDHYPVSAQIINNIEFVYTIFVYLKFNIIWHF